MSPPSLGRQPHGTDVSGRRGKEQPPRLMPDRGSQVVHEGVDATVSIAAKNPPEELPYFDQEMPRHRTQHF